MGDAQLQDLTVLWTDVERVTAEMEPAVQAVRGGGQGIDGCPGHGDDLKTAE